MCSRIWSTRCRNREKLPAHRLMGEVIICANQDDFLWEGAETCDSPAGAGRDRVVIPADPPALPHQFNPVFHRSM